MKHDDAVAALAALAQPMRLAVFRALVRAADPAGVRAGDLAVMFDLPKPTLSFHLKELSRAGLIDSSRDGRSIWYRLRPDGIRDLITYLSEDCCEGRPELCLPAGGKGTCRRPAAKAR